MASFLRVSLRLTGRTMRLRSSNAPLFRNAFSQRIKKGGCVGDPTPASRTGELDRQVVTGSDGSERPQKAIIRQQPTDRC